MTKTATTSISVFNAENTHFKGNSIADDEMRMFAEKKAMLLHYWQDSCSSVDQQGISSFFKF